MENEEAPEIRVQFEDGSVFTMPNESWRKAFWIKYGDSEEKMQEALDQFVEEVRKHWEEKTVPTKFNKDDSWFAHFKDQLHWDEDCEWYPETMEKTRMAEERVNWDRKAKEILGEGWTHPVPRTYLLDDERSDDEEYPQPFQVRESGDTLERKLEDDLTLPEVDKPTYWSNEDSLKYVVLPSDKFEEWEDLVVERSKAEVEVVEEVDERAREQMDEPLFETMAELAKEVMYYSGIRSAVMGIVFSKLSDGDGEVMALGDGKVTYYSEHGKIEKDLEAEE